MTSPSISHQMSLGSRLREARENYQYWKRQCELRFNPSAQREAGARMLAWKSTITAGEQLSAESKQLSE